ncbi:sulfur oxidation c-type cytochrome SoxX [Thalassococcus sp. S3]|uniref:sulfur oxidation c-type cytochrome SoxX n=1 Tax=Thalassococcus sp. S3 TaxID=2017482 RepID=UPI0010240F05|nr:sulfur oxidation c-type cytochrome SoxX [Thalassococcus sp. S3]QBF32599.1 sulfur oxidation c-type cytochrome SoxX [Thalassococcus sp. S3]
MRRIVTIAALFLGQAAWAGDVVAPADVSYDDGIVEASLTGVAGDPVAGRETFANRKLGNCLACHMNSDMPEESFHGEVGPMLDGAADRWSEAELRGIVSNSKMMFEGTIMPAFYVDAGYTRPLDDFAGTPILTAQQVEDVVAYLMTLKEE